MDKTKIAILMLGMGLGVAGGNLVALAIRDAHAAVVPGVHAFDVRTQREPDGGTQYLVHAYGHVIIEDGGFVDLSDVPVFSVDQVAVKPLHDRVVQEWAARKFPDSGF